MCDKSDGSQMRRECRTGGGSSPGETSEQPADGVATSHGRSTASNKEHSKSASTHGASIQCRPLSNVLRIPACGVKTQIRTAVELLRFEVGLG